MNRISLFAALSLLLGTCLSSPTLASQTRLSPLPDPAFFTRAAFSALEVQTDKKTLNKGDVLVQLLRVLTDNANDPEDQRVMQSLLDRSNWNREALNNPTSTLSIEVAREIQAAIPRERVDIAKAGGADLVENLVKTALFSDQGDQIRIDYTPNTPQAKEHILSLIMTYLADRRAETYDPEVAALMSIRPPRSAGVAPLPANLNYKVNFITRKFLFETAETDDNRTVEELSQFLPAPAESQASQQLIGEMRSIQAKLNAEGIPIRVRVQDSRVDVLGMTTVDPAAFWVYFEVEGLKYAPYLENSVRMSLMLAGGNSPLYRVAKFAENFMQNVRGVPFLKDALPGSMMAHVTGALEAFESGIGKVADASGGAVKSRFFPNGDMVVESVKLNTERKLKDMTAQLIKAATNIDPEYGKWLANSTGADKTRLDWLTRPILDKQAELEPLIEPLTGLERDVNALRKDVRDRLGGIFQAGSEQDELMRKVIEGTATADDYQKLHGVFAETNRLGDGLTDLIKRLEKAEAEFKATESNVVKLTQLIQRMRATAVYLSELPKTRLAIEAAIRQVRATKDWMQYWPKWMRLYREYRAAKDALAKAERARVLPEIVQEVKDKKFLGMINTKNPAITKFRVWVRVGFNVERMRMWVPSIQVASIFLSGILITHHLSSAIYQGMHTDDEFEMTEIKKRLLANLATDVIYFVPFFGEVAIAMDLLNFLIVDPICNRILHIHNNWFGTYNLMSRLMDGIFLVTSPLSRPARRFEATLKLRQSQLGMLDMVRDPSGSFLTPELDQLKRLRDQLKAGEPVRPDEVKRAMHRFAEGTRRETAGKILAMLYHLGGAQGELLTTDRAREYMQKLKIEWNDRYLPESNALLRELALIISAPRAASQAPAR